LVRERGKYKVAIGKLTSKYMVAGWKLSENHNLEKLKTMGKEQKT
jgi:hypothetical protein